MGGICCKDSNAAGESLPDEKVQAPGAQGTLSTLTGAAETASGHVIVKPEPNREPADRRATNDEGQSQAAGISPTIRPAAAEAAESAGDTTGIDSGQVLLSETPLPATSSVPQSGTPTNAPTAQREPAQVQIPVAIKPPDAPTIDSPPAVGVGALAERPLPSTPPSTPPSAAIGLQPPELQLEAPNPTVAFSKGQDIVLEGESVRLSTPALDMVAGASTTPYLDAVQAMSVARPSHAGNTPSSAVKVETTRRSAHPSAGDGSSSVSYSHSATSSQQQGSSQMAGHGLSPMLGSSAAVVVPAGETTRPKSTTPTQPVAEEAGEEAAEAALPEMSPEDGAQPADAVAGKTAAPKATNAGFMFGAPRVKDHKEKRRKAPRAKSQSSGSNQSGPQAPTGSDTITGSKASGAASASDPVTASRPPGIAGSSVAVAPAPGSSAAAPSLSSTDVPSSSVVRSLVAQGSSALAPGGPGSSAPDGAGSSRDYRSIGRRVKAIKGSTEGSSGHTQGSSVTCSMGGQGTAGAGVSGSPGVGTVMEEALPEGDVEGEGGEEEVSDRSSERSSSEHLSIMSPPEGSDVENVLQLICNIFQLPVALVAAYRSSNIFIRSTALRLTDDDQWRYSLAQWSMLNTHELRDVLMVPNAPRDERFREYYCVKNEPRVRFFMASPLRSSTGELLGTLCMADFTERALEPANLLVVNNLQTLVIKQLERDVSLAAERAENEAATEKLQQEMMRALDHFEKCIMFVDTSKPGWEVLYTNMAWEHVTGIPREHVMGRIQDRTAAAGDARVPRVHVVGRPLQDFFMALGGAALDWSSTVAEVASRSEFTVHRVALRQKPDKLVSLHLRRFRADTGLAETEGLASQQATGELEGLLPRGLPSWVKMRGNEQHNYFVFVEEVDTKAGGGSTVYEALAKHVEKVPGLELSHLLGKGGFGSVYYGTWNGVPVAVKMIDNRLTKTNTDGISLEALMGQELSHPNIVKTIKYVMRSGRDTSSSFTGSNSRGAAGSNPRGAVHSRHSGVPHPGVGGVGSHHGSRNPGLAGATGAGAPGSGNANGGNGGMVATSNAQGLSPYMTSAQPGLSGMTSAQMMAALDLTSASAMQHLQRSATHMTSNATTAAGGGSSCSGAMGGAQGDPSSGVPLRVGNLIGSSTPAAHIAEEPNTAGTSTTGTSNLTAVGPASIVASSTSTAAGPPSVASGGGVPANTALSSDASCTASGTNMAVAARAEVPHAAATLPAVARVAGAVANPSPRSSESFRKKMSATVAAAASGHPAPQAPAAAPPLTAPAGPSRAGAAAMTAAAPAHVQPQLTPEQQAAMTSRFSLAFSTITSGGDVLVPGKGSPSSSSGAGKTQQQVMGSAGSGEDMGEVWIIMEFCDRGSLQDALDRGALKLRKANGEIGETHLPMMVATACEVASALQYLHGKGIVHGDLTAWNVMLCTGQQDRSGRTFVAKVADFGLSRTLDLKSKIKTRTYGTISHMPPECLISGIISKATDVFAFGVLLWQMYTGLRPWAGMNHGQIIYNVGMKNVQLLFPPGTPPAIADLSSSCTRTDPVQRPSFVEIMDKLDKIRASLGL